MTTTPPRLRFEELTSPEVGEAARNNTLLLFPIGQTEEHGDHLGLHTDAKIAEEIALRVAAAVHADGIPVLVLPTLWAGYSNSVMQHWPGTLRVRTRVVMDYVHDICESVIQMGFTKLCLMNTHGHHPDLLRVVVRELADELGVHVAIADPVYFCAEAYIENRKSKPGGSIHGGEYETSLMLYLGGRVEMERATDIDRMRYASRFSPADHFSGKKPVFWSTWGLQTSKTGIYGDPTPATAELGRLMVERAIATYREFLREYWEFKGPLPAEED